MGLIKLVRGISRPVQSQVSKMTAQHRGVLDSMVATRRQILAVGPLAAVGALMGSSTPAPAPSSGLWFPEDPLESQLSTYPCDPNTPDTQYRDKYFPLQPNPVTVAVGPSATQLARENKTRTQMFIVNADVVPLLIGFGFPPTFTNYSLPMAACASANDGNGGIIVDANFKGAVWAIVGANQLQNGTVLFNEIFDES